MRILAAAITLVMLVPIRADIAPTHYAGGTLVPLEISDLRFNDAHVVITWGYPCKLDASFEIISERKDPISLEIGFPVGGYDPVYGYDGEQVNADEVTKSPVPASTITIVVNSKSVPAFRRVNTPDQCEIRFGRASWYFTNTTLVPGKNHIEVKTFLTPSGVYGRPFERRIEYCIWTGGRWNGEITHERIDVVFPSVVSKRLITEIKPEWFQTLENRLVWELSKIRPRSNYYDLNLVVRLPEVVDYLQTLEEDYCQRPNNSTAALTLAKHLFHLGNVKGNSGFPPSSLPATEFHRLRKLMAGDDQTILERHYSVQRAKTYQETSSEWSDDRVRLVQILADIGYCENYSGVGEVLEAKALVEKVLECEPSNEAAWLLYLSNYWRFSFAAAGHWFGSTALSKRQKADITKAHRACPTSSEIAAWYEFAEGKSKAPPAFQGLEQSSEFTHLLRAAGEPN